MATTLTVQTDMASPSLAAADATGNSWDNSTGQVFFWVANASGSSITVTASEIRTCSFGHTAQDFTATVAAGITAALGPFDTDAATAGLDNWVIPWLKERDVAVVGWETAGYVPQPEGDLGRLALHNFVLTMLGVPLLDRADLDALAEAAAERNRWEFMLTVAPLPIPNGTGSPINPIAIF